MSHTRATRSERLQAISCMFAFQKQGGKQCYQNRDAHSGGVGVHQRLIQWAPEAAPAAICKG